MHTAPRAYSKSNAPGAYLISIFFQIINGPGPYVEAKISNKIVHEPNVSPHKQIIKDDDVKECISTE